MNFLTNYLANLFFVPFNKQPFFPLMFSYYVTHQCPLNCKYCCDGDGKRFKEDPIAELSTKDAKRLLSGLRKASDTIDFTGGEPLVRSDLEEIMEHSKNLGFRTILNTKGIGLETRPKLLESTDVLVISIDSLKPESISDLIDRPFSVAERILTALEFALSARKKLGFKVVLSSVATPTNISDLEGVLSFAVENRLGFHVSPEIVGTSVNPALRENLEYKSFIDKVLDVKEKGMGVLGVPEYLLGIKHFSSFNCHPQLMPVIRPDGRMYYPCLESKNAKINLLNYRNYFSALRDAKREFGKIPACFNCCHIFCHMGLSLYQRHPISAFRELRNWRN